MPAHQISTVRAKRPLTCDVCSKSIAPNAAVTVCTHCKRVRHLACSSLPCPACGHLHRRTALYRAPKVLRYF